MTRPDLPPLTLEEITTYTTQELFAHDPALREWRVTLAQGRELADLIKREFSPRQWPECAGLSRSDLLWSFLPELHQRMTTPERWRSHPLLLEAQQHAAETLSQRLHSLEHSTLSSTFSVRPDAQQIVQVMPRPLQNSGLNAQNGLMIAAPLGFTVVAVILKLFLLLPLLLIALVFRLVQTLKARPAVVRQVHPALPPASGAGTPPLLLSAPAVRELSFELERNLARAEQSSDPGWRYHARAALDEYLPETLRLHAERQGQPDDPEFQTALNRIREIATQGSDATDLRWDAHERFLEDKARSLEREDE